MNNTYKFYKEIVKHNNRKGLGYESTMDFNFGYLSALITNKLINRKEYFLLKKVFSEENDECIFSIDRNGKLIKIN